MPAASAVVCSSRFHQLWPGFVIQKFPVHGSGKSETSFGVPVAGDEGFRMQQVLFLRVCVLHITPPYLLVLAGDGGSGYTLSYSGFRTGDVGNLKIFGSPVFVLLLTMRREREREREGESSHFGSSVRTFVLGAVHPSWHWGGGTGLT